MEIYEHKALIKTRILFLKEVNFEEIKDYLIQEEILSVDEKDTLENISTPKEQISKLHDVLLKSKEAIFGPLCEVGA